MNSNIFYSLIFHSIMIVLTALSLPFMTREPIDLPPILSVDLIQITDKTSIPFAAKATETLEKIIPKILAISNNRTDTRIYVRGDKTINYGRVLEVMGMLSGAGFSKVALISEPYKN